LQISWMIETKKPLRNCVTACQAASLEHLAPNKEIRGVVLARY